MSGITLEDLKGVYAVPPLPRKPDGRRSLNFDAAESVASHVEAGGITRYLYGGNAFLYHITLEEYDALLGWLAGFAAPRWAIPSLGPSFGRAIDQSRLLRRHRPGGGTTCPQQAAHRPDLGRHPRAACRF